MEKFVESQVLELKAMVPDKNILIETIYSFANAEGGTIVIGYDEVNHAEIGIDKRGCDRVINYLTTINDNIVISVEKKRIKANRYCLFIYVNKSNKKVLLNGKEYIRDGNKTKVLDVSTISNDVHRISLRENDDDYIEQLIYQDNLTLNDPYVRCLDKLIKNNNNICNIGVIGPYGSGKSSIVHSYINLKKWRKKKTLFFSQETIKKHLDDVSFENNKNEDAKNNNSTNIQEPGKKNINIKSFIYLELLRCDKDAIDYRRYLSNLATPVRFKFLGWLLGASMSILFGFVAFVVLYNHISFWASVVIGVLSALTIGSLLLMYEAVKFKLVGKNGEVEFVNKIKDIEDNIRSSPASIDNLILKILKKRKIEFIVIEDMERLKDYKYSETSQVIDIVENFKVISDLVNRSNVFKEKNRVKFIYGLNDDCFPSSEIRSKYFDAIIPVIPLTTNVGAVTVIKNHKVLKDKKISDIIVRDISLFFENQRQVNAFITQFYLVTRYVKLDLYDELFALTAFNVLFPQEYHNLYKDSEKLKKFLLKEIDEYVDTKSADNVSVNNKRINDFLSLCRNKGYINLTFEECLTRNIGLYSLSSNDMKYLVDSASGKDTLLYRIENPEAVINYYDSKILFGKDDYLNYYLVDYIYKNSFNYEINCFVDSSSTHNKEKFAKLLLEILMNSSVEVAELVLSHFSNNEIAYSSVSKIRDNHKRLAFINCLTQSLDTSLIKDDKVIIDVIYQNIKSKEYILRFNKSLSINLLKLIFDKDDKKLDSVFSIENKDVLDYIKNNLIYPFDRLSIEHLYKDYRICPIRTINANNDTLGVYFRKTVLRNYNSAFPLVDLSILDKNEDIIRFIENNNDGDLDRFFSSKYFDHWKFKLTLTTSPFRPTKNEKLIKNYKVAIEHNLLEPNNAYLMYFMYEKPSNIIPYIIDNKSLLLVKQIKLSNQLSLYLMNEIKDYQILYEIQDIMDYSGVSSSIESLPANSLIISYNYIDNDTIGEQIVKRLWNLDRKHIIEGAISLKTCINININSDDCKLIIDSECKQLYYLLFLNVNTASISKYLNNDGSTKLLRDVLDSVDIENIENITLLINLLLYSKKMDKDISIIEKMNISKIRTDDLVKLLKAYTKVIRGNYYIPASESGKKMLSIYEANGIVRKERSNSKKLIRISFVSA